MAQNTALAGNVVLVGASFAWIANAIGSQYWQYPFIYCWAGQHVAPLYNRWGTMILYIGAATLIYQLLRGSMVKAFMLTVILTLIVELPRLATQMFSVGGSCE